MESFKQRGNVKSTDRNTQGEPLREKSLPRPSRRPPAPDTAPVSYAELFCKTNYSFLVGASHADELVERAVELGYRALAVTDENTLAGVVRAFAAARETDLKLLIGAEIIPCDAPPVVLWAMDRAGYASLSRLITTGRRRAPKGDCWIEFDDIAKFHSNLLAGVIPKIKGDRSRTAHIDENHTAYQWHQRPDVQTAQGYHELFGKRAYLLASLYQGVDDAWRISELQRISGETALPVVAAGDVLYHAPARQPLHDVLTATRHHTTVDQAGELLLPNAGRHLRFPAGVARAMKNLPGAIERTVEIADRVEFCLSQLRYEYPRELAPDGMTPVEYLRKLTEAGLKQRYPEGESAKVRKQIEHELALIDELHYEAYFLTVWDIVRFARSRGILCQGRGSAANSAVCYALGVTSVDPSKTDLLFERFISKERNEAPDIDVDFEHERREEVLQYLYDKYGRERAGLASTVITYRSRSAIRDVGKALGLSLDRVDALAKQVDGYQNVENLRPRMETVGIDPDSETGMRLAHLSTEILGFPRHLSQHVGGMVIARDRLDELVPIENAAMDDRTVIQWDKEDLEELGLLKVDCLCLGMLSAIRKCFHMIEKHYGRHLTLATVPAEDPTVYDMICAADTVGVFQIESRGQMSMLPRLKPRCFYDLVIEVAIVRPGPIQGNMVHPFLRRRNGDEPVVYPNEEIKAVLHRTLGVPIFQEQAMKLAVVAAGFTPGQADQLRRAMGAWRKTGVIEVFRQQLMDGMSKKGLNDEFAMQVFNQIRGFGEYGFPESHAASFALLVYVSAWLKCYYPAAFCAAIINSQPMGFYAPAQLIACARKHGVEVLPVDVNLSHWDCTLEKLHGSEEHAMRMGLRMISGIRSDSGEAILEARQFGRFECVAGFTRRTGLGQSVVAQLSKADAFGSVNQDRRAALWQALAQEKRPQDQPLFDCLDAEDDDADLLPQMDSRQQVSEDYRTVGLSLRAHPVSFFREQLDEFRVVTCAGLEQVENNRHTRVAGLVILRQRPSTAKGITFVTLEDETGTANLVVRRQIWDRYYKICRGSGAWIAHGKLEKKSGVIHVVVNRLEDMSNRLAIPKIKTRDFR
ncbi:MAG: error-prone DNA polymerase [Planctomycetota bacterium]